MLRKVARSAAISARRDNFVAQQQQPGEPERGHHGLERTGHPLEQFLALGRQLLSWFAWNHHLARTYSSTNSSS
jgi:hypothetical protein